MCGRFHATLKHYVRSFNSHPEWGEAGGQLLRPMDEFKFANTWDQIAAGKDKIFPSAASKMMAMKQEISVSSLGPATIKRSRMR